MSSLMRVLIGLFSGSLAGIAVGIFIGWKDVANRTLGPVISLLFPIPALGWLPLFMLWVGINEMLPILIIFVCSFFPVVYNTATGIKNVDRSFIQAAEMLGASNLRVLSDHLPCLPTSHRSEVGGRNVVAGPHRRGDGCHTDGHRCTPDEAESLVRVDISWCASSCSPSCASSLKRLCFGGETMVAMNNRPEFQLAKVNNTSAAMWISNQRWRGLCHCRNNGAENNLAECDRGHHRLNARCLSIGVDMNGVSPRRGVWLFSARLALFPHLTVASNIAFGLKQRLQQDAVDKGLFPHGYAAYYQLATISPMLSEAKKKR